VVDEAGAAPWPAVQALLGLTERALAEVIRLREEARVDLLTGVLNRRGFLERLDDELARADRSKAAFTLVLCDLDDFKALNDTRGHPAGDAALRAFTDLLAANLRLSDSVGRLGGDEFGLILVGAAADDADAILARLTAAVEGSVGGGGLRASFGTARAPEDGTTADALIAAADARLYAAKRAGR
jgi:diguanylate cyclase (GGDEF)-like protein